MYRQKIGKTSSCSRSSDLYDKTLTQDTGGGYAHESCHDNYELRCATVNAFDWDPDEGVVKSFWLMIPVYVYDSLCQRRGRVLPWDTWVSSSSEPGSCKIPYFTTPSEFFGWAGWARMTHPDLHEPNRTPHPKTEESFTLADPMPRLCPDAVGSANIAMWMVSRHGIGRRGLIGRPSGGHRGQY